MLHLIFGRAGTGKTQWIYDAMRRLPHTAQRLLIVPEQYSFESERTLLRLPGQAGGEVLSFSRLCDRLFKTYGGIAGTRVSEGEKLLLMARAVRQTADGLDIYRKYVKNADFYRHLLAAVSEFKYCGITPQALADASLRLPEGALQAKVNALSAVMGAYNALVAESFTDPDDDLLRLHTLLQQHAYFAEKTVFIDSFKSFTAPQLAILEQIIATADDVYVTLCADGLQPKHELELFANTKKTAATLIRMARDAGVAVAPSVVLTENHRAKVSSLAAMECILSGHDAPAADDGDDGVTLYTCSSPYEEAEWVASTICRLVRTGACRHRDIMIIARDTAAYDDILDAALDRYGVPYFSDRRRPVAGQPLAACLLKGLKLAAQSWDSDDILSLLKTGMTGLSSWEIASLENYALIWNLTGAGWRRPFTRHPDGAEAGEPDPAALDALNALRERVAAPLEALGRQCTAARTARDFCTALYDFLTRLHASEQLQALADRLTEAGDAFAAEDALRAWDVMMGVLDQAVTALGDTPLSPKEFFDLFTLLVNGTDMGKIPQGLDQVVIGSADRTRPAEPRAVFVIGAGQGIFPAAPASGGLLTDRDRLQLNQIDLPVSDRCAFETVEENFLFYAAACAAGERVYFSAVCSTGGEQPKTLCAPLVTLAAALPACRRETEAIRQIRDPLARVEAPTPAFDLLCARSGEDTPLTRGLTRYFQQADPARLAVLERVRTAPSLTLTPPHAADLFGQSIRVSPSGVEVYHQCRFRYFCRYGLRVYPRKPVTLDELSRGKLVHYVLEQMILRHGSRGLAALTARQLQQNVEDLLTQYVDEKLGGQQEKPPTFLYRLDRVKTLLVSLLEHMARELYDSLFETAACELPIGMDPTRGVPALRILLPGGASLSVIGVVDRLDVYQHDGQTYFRVVDYKSGGKSFHLEDVYYGIGLQMLLYLLAVEKNGGRFGDNRIPAGVLYMPVARKSADATEDAEAHAAALAKTLQMQGLVLDDPVVMDAMDPHHTGLFLPFKRNPDGTVDRHSRLASLAFFGNIHRQIETLLLEMGDSLRRGDITCDPLDGVDTDACRYCDYKAACPAGGEALHRTVTKLTAAQQEALRKGGDYRELVSHAPTESGH